MCVGVHVSGDQVSRCVSACVFESNLLERKLHLCAISHFVLVVAAVSYLSASEDFFILVELDGFFRTVSACVCSVCLSVCVFLALLVCVCACVHQQNYVCFLLWLICV